MSMIAKNRIHSTWTPLSNEETNNKIFEERKELVSKWFSKWTDDQRKKILEELVSKGKSKQLVYARKLIDSRFPCTKDDFTRYLPRVLTLYIFSFLDSTSLCQCAEVCWYWRYLGELDQLWMPKCLHFGWVLTFTPSPYENGVWKRNFSEQFKMVKSLMARKPTVSEVSKLKLDSKHLDSAKEKKSGPQPWRDSDPVPKDIWRFNYLNNDEVLDEVLKHREKKAYGSATDNVIRNARSRTNNGTNILNALTKSQSLTRISSASMDSSSNHRPRWAKQTTGFIHKNAMQYNGVLAKIMRPGPISPPPKVPLMPKSRPVTARSVRDPPTTELFSQTPWKLPDSDSDVE